jgi:hypothetical protein
MKRFTSKMYLVTYECGIGGYSRSYGIVGVFNKPTEASRHIAKLEKEQEKKSPRERIQYKQKTLDIENPLTTELFRFEY